MSELINTLQLLDSSSAQETIMSTNFASSSGTSGSDVISLAIGIPSFIVAMVSLIVTIWALYYAKKQFVDKKKKKKQTEVAQRDAELKRRMRQG